MNSPQSSTAAYEIARERLKEWLLTESGVSEAAARQLSNYFVAIYKALGVIPSQEIIVLERFFDESGGMQLVLHSPFGIRINRAWGLALRKRFCRSFNFELQAAATDDAIVLSLGTQHSFPLEEVFRYLNSKTVRDLLVQALLDAPMFPIRWRWNASRALALPRQRGGHKVPAPLQRMESENLLAAVFPDQLACLENIVGDREIPEHPLVAQTIDDCLTEAMDIDGLIRVLKRIEGGHICCIARDLPEPSPLAHEILNARPYAFLDNAPLEERRTHAVLTRRASEDANSELGILDAAAIERIGAEAWPKATNTDELHEALLLAGVMTEEELAGLNADAKAWLEELASQRRAGRVRGACSHARPPDATRPKTEPVESGSSYGEFWVAAERLPMIQAIYSDSESEPPLSAPESERTRMWEPENAMRELVRGRLEISGPVTARALAEFLHVPETQVEAALLALEGEGFVLRGKFHPNAQEMEWCERRLLARIHRLTINRLRAEIQPVSLAEFQRFLLAWQRLDSEHRAQGPEGLQAVLELLDGYEVPAAAWEPEVLAARVENYTPQWLDQLCFTGRIGWGRLTPPANPNGRPFAPVRSSPISLFLREHLPDWLLLTTAPEVLDFSPDTLQVLQQLQRNGALFFGELTKQRSLLPSRIEQALAELVAQGWVTADSFEGLRALLVPQEKRASFAGLERRRRHKTVTSLEFAGRWSLLQNPAEAVPTGPPAHHARTSNTSSRGHAAAPAPGYGTGNLEGTADGSSPTRDEAVETFARVLLRRYGLVFRRLLERESLKVSWFDLGRVYRRLEARGEIRGGYFVNGVSGEQFALPEAIALMRSIRKQAPTGECVVISGADPLNLAGILTPGPRVAALTANRILLRDGVPIAALQGEDIVRLQPNELNGEIERSLRTGTMPAALRRYYG